MNTSLQLNRDVEWKGVYTGTGTCFPPNIGGRGGGGLEFYGLSREL